ncbi:hypothetical protein QJS66_11840 [Kocuria rhizophila]|nr:hypothetical protein QJS66_11840 [Kocuria rhizophila]
MEHGAECCGVRPPGRGHVLCAGSSRYNHEIDHQLQRIIGLKETDFSAMAL